MGMVYYDWNIDRLGHIWPGFVHYYIPKNGTEADATLCPYIKTDLSRYEDVAEDPRILQNTKFNDNALEYMANASDATILNKGLNTDSWPTLTPLKPGEVMTADKCYDTKYDFINDKRLTVVRLLPTDVKGELDEITAPENGHAYYLLGYEAGVLVNGIKWDETTNQAILDAQGNTIPLANATDMNAFSSFLWYVRSYCSKRWTQDEFTLYDFGRWAVTLRDPNYPINKKNDMWQILTAFWGFFGLRGVIDPTTGQAVAIPASLPDVATIDYFWPLINAQRPDLKIFDNNALCLLHTNNLFWNSTLKLHMFKLGDDWYRPVTNTSSGIYYWVDNPVYKNVLNNIMQIRSNSLFGTCTYYTYSATYKMKDMVLFANEFRDETPIIQNTEDITATSTTRTNDDNLALIYMDGGNYVKANYNVMARHYYTTESIFVKAINIKPVLSDNRNVDEILDEALNDPKNAWKTPKEYYAQGATTDTLPEGENGYLKSKVLMNNDEDKMTKPVWWWSNTLANWCTFKRTTQYTTELFVWNGKNGWDKFDEIMKEPRYTGSSKVLYYYDITRFIKGPRMTSAIVHDSMRFDYKSIKMIHDTKFSHYDERNYQTVRLPKVHYASKGTDRYPNTIGIPVLCRLPSGEVEIFYTLKLPGMSKNVDVVRTDNIDFINSVCKAYFGDGDDKQIMTDWKRFYKIIASGDESATDIILDNESTLYDAEEINTIHTDMDKFSITLSVPRQYPETDEGTKGDYVERWES